MINFNILGFLALNDEFAVNLVFIISNVRSVIAEDTGFDLL